MGASNSEVAIKVGLTDSETIEVQKQYRRLIGADKFCQIYDEMSGNLEHFISLYQELKNANVSFQDALEGVETARNLHQIKFLNHMFETNLQVKNQAIYYSLQEYKALKNQIHSFRSQIEMLNEAKTRLWSEIEGKLRSQEPQPTKTHRRRIVRARSYDTVSRNSTILDSDPKGSSEKVSDLMSLEN
jgi:hypothetical protein